MTDKARELLAALYEAQPNKAAAFTVRSVGAVGTVLETQLSLIAAALQGQEGVREAVDILTEALGVAAFTFETYAKLHSAKGTAEGYEKASKNAEMAERCFTALETARAALSTDPAPEGEGE